MKKKIIIGESAILCIVGIFLIIVSIIGSVTISNLNNQITKKENKLSDLDIKYSTLENAFKETQDEYIVYVQNFGILLNEQMDRIISLKQKYGASLTISNKQDFTMKELLYLDSICQEYGISTAVMLAIYENESTFYSLAKNPTSGATGYGQLIASTAKSIYERYLKEGTYDTSKHYQLASDKELNIRLSCRLMKYNLDSYGNYWTAVERYFGHSDAGKRYAYAAGINNKMSKYGESLK